MIEDIATKLEAPIFSNKRLEANLYNEGFMKSYTGNRSAQFDFLIEEVDLHNQ